MRDAPRKEFRVGRPGAGAYDCPFSIFPIIPPGCPRERPWPPGRCPAGRGTRRSRPPPPRLASVTRAATLAVIPEKSMKAFLMSERMGTTVSRTSTILKGALPFSGGLSPRSERSGRFYGVPAKNRSRASRSGSFAAAQPARDARRPTERGGGSVCRGRRERFMLRRSFRAERLFLRPGEGALPDRREDFPSVSGRLRGKRGRDESAGGAPGRRAA